MQEISAKIRAIAKERPMLVGVFSTIAAVLFASGYLSRREAAMMRVIEPVSVAVASRDLGPGEAIDESSVSLVAIPRRFVQPAAFSSVKEVAGRIAAVAIKYGAHLTPANASRPSIRGGVAPLIPAGRRAISVALDEDNAGRIVRPNDFVDVIATFDLGSESSIRRTTLAVIENVQVLAVGGEVADELPQNSESTVRAGIFGVGAKPTSPRAGAALALAVTPSEAQKLAFAQNAGSLRIAVRPAFGFEEPAKIPPTTIQTITGGHDELMPARRGFREYKGR